MQDIPRYLKIDGSQDWIRDTHSMGVLNMNRQALEAAKRKKDQAQRIVLAEQRKDTELNTMREELSQLKALVMQLLKDKG
jgi:hypothetical protein